MPLEQLVSSVENIHANAKCDADGNLASCTCNNRNFRNIIYKVHKWTKCPNELRAKMD